MPLESLLDSTCLYCDTDRSKAVVLLLNLMSDWVLSFLCMCMHIIFCSVKATEWPPFGK